MKKKAYDKAYSQTPERKAYHKAYNKAREQTPEYKAYQKTRRQNPEGKAYHKAYKRAYNQTIIQQNTARNYMTALFAAQQFIQVIETKPENDQ